MPLSVDITRDEIVRKIVSTAVAVSDGYKANHCPRCQDGEIASSNTGYHILMALGFSHDESRAMFEEARRGE
jgi:hypothetical protein